MTEPSSLALDAIPPIVAILRGITPAEAMTVGSALIDAGIRMIEVPLNSPEPYDSIEQLQVEFGDIAMIGAGTVLDQQSVKRLANMGAKLMVTPHIDPPLIASALELGLHIMPGFVTPSEAFAAIRAGARQLKLFPAATLGTGHLKAMRDVLPKDVQLWAVGGTDARNFTQWLDAGASGIGVGGALYRPGDTAEVVGERASELVAIWRGRAA